MPRIALSLGFAVLLASLAASGAGAATLKSIGTFNQPTYVTSDPEDSSRILVVERQGRVVEVAGGGAPTLYADLTDYVTCCAGERGLLSIAPAPDFHASGLFYAAYTGKPAAGGAEGDIHVDAFVADANGNVTRTQIIAIGHTPESNHNGGQLQFGPDGHLYISTGDGGGGGDPFETGQDRDALLGKILRIDPHPGSTPAYTIPAGNPFAGATLGADEIWAYGLRNPWRFSFDSLTGDLAIADVGQGAREEVDLAPSPSAGTVGGAGVDYGWSCREGFLAYSSPAANCEGAGGFTEPVFDYPHSGAAPGAAHGCAITGGYVVRDPSLTDLYGRYVYADYCAGEIRSLVLPGLGESAAGDDRSAGITTPTPNPTSFGEDSCHRIYVASGSRSPLRGATIRRPSALAEEAPAARTPRRNRCRRRRAREAGGCAGGRRRGTATGGARVPRAEGITSVLRDETPPRPPPHRRARCALFGMERRGGTARPRRQAGRKEAPRPTVRGRSSVSPRPSRERRPSGRGSGRGRQRDAAVGPIGHLDRAAEAPESVSFDDRIRGVGEMGSVRRPGEVPDLLVGEIGNRLGAGAVGVDAPDLAFVGRVGDPAPVRGPGRGPADHLLAAKSAQAAAAGRDLVEPGTEIAVGGGGQGDRPCRPVTRRLRRLQRSTASGSSRRRPPARFRSAARAGPRG